MNQDSLPNIFSNYFAKSCGHPRDQRNIIYCNKYHRLCGNCVIANKEQFDYLIKLWDLNQ